MADITLKVIIDPKDVEMLITAGYNLCLTRDVLLNGIATRGNMVFAAVPSKDLGPSITFRWREQYQIYGITGLKPPKKSPDAIVETEIANIEEGQDATLTASGKIDIFGSSLAGEPFKVKNEWKHPARIVAKLYDSTEYMFSPIFTSAEVPSSSTTRILPAQRYSIFLDDDLVNGAMIWDEPSTPYFSFTYTNQSEIRISYIEGKWALV